MKKAKTQQTSPGELNPSISNLNTDGVSLIYY